MKRDSARQKYYRRYAINYDHTIRYKSFETFLSKTREKEETQNQEVVHEKKDIAEEKNSSNTTTTTIGVKISLR